MPNSVTTALQGGFTHMSNGVIGQLTSAELSAKYPGLTLKTPTANFSFRFSGHTIAFEKGRPVMCPADLLAALTAANAAVA